MVNNPHLSDVQFQVDSGDVLYAHLFVLYARCPAAAQAVSAAGFLLLLLRRVQTTPSHCQPVPQTSTELLGLMATASGSAVGFQLRKPE